MGYATLRRHYVSVAAVRMSASSARMVRARIHEAYPGDTWEETCRGQNARYAPTNLFRLNHNVTPR